MIATTEKFGIFSDILGIREDIPCIKLDDAFSPEDGSENVFLDDGVLKRMPGRLAELFDNTPVQIPTPDGYPVIHYHRHFDSTNTQFLFLFTKAHIYRWRSDTSTYMTMFTCSGTCEMWESVSFKGLVIATNWVDKVIYWNETKPGTAFAPLDTAGGLDTDGGTTKVTKAKYLTVYEDYVIIGFTLEGGTIFPFRIRWCSLRSETDWQSEGGAGDAGYKDFVEEPGLLKGFGHYTAYNTNILIVFKNFSYSFGWLVETDEIFNWSKINSKVGLLATHSVLNDKDGRCYFIGNDYKVREIREGIISDGIDKSMRRISPTYEHLIESAFIHNYNMLCWSIPGSGGSTGLDKLIRFNLTRKIWEIDNFAIRAFGSYSRQTTYTIATYPGTIDEATEIIDSSANIAGFPIELASDYSGYTYSLHNSFKDRGHNYTSKMVLTTDLAKGQGLNIYKRLWSMQFWLLRKAGAITISIKRDNEKNWLVVGTVNMTDKDEADIVIKDLPCDIRARHLLIKIESTVDFGFLGLVFDFHWDGDR